MQTGIVSREKFLPTIAAMTELLAEHRASRDQFKPAHTTHKYLTPELDPVAYETDSARRKRLVAEILGYDPNHPVGREKPAFETVPLDKLKSSADLKTPDRPISDELRQQLIDSGWPYFQSQEKAA